MCDYSMTTESIYCLRKNIAYINTNVHLLRLHIFRRVTMIQMISKLFCFYRKIYRIL